MLASRSLPFDPQAAAVGIGRTVGTIRTASPEGIVDGVRRERRTVAAEGITRGVGVVGVRAQLATIISLLVIESWRVVEGTSGSEWMECRVKTNEDYPFPTI